MAATMGRQLAPLPAPLLQEACPWSAATVELRLRFRQPNSARLLRPEFSTPLHVSILFFAKKLEFRLEKTFLL